MGQIEDLEQRISAAFARITAGVEALSASSAPPASEPPASEPPQPDSGLQQALDEERMANAQLNERVRALHAAEQSQRDQVESLTRQLDEQGLDVQRLSSTVAQLREDLRRLREAAEQGVVDPSLINKAMLAELEALRATRASETTEMNDILAALGGVLEAEEARAHA